MANTVFGPYTKTTWVDNTTQGTHVTLNNLESQAGIALNGFNGDLLTAFILSGMVCTKDGTTANQLDVTAGRAYITMSDGTLGLIITAASTASQFLTVTPSTTYYLDLNPDGTWSFATSHSAQTNHLTICSVTTDVSGNINAVTDARTLNVTFLGGMEGVLSLPPVTIPAGTNVKALAVSASNNAGTAVAAIQNTAVNNANADILDLQRLTNQPQTFTLGVDPFGQFYVYDHNAAAFALVGIKAGSPVVTNRNGTGLLAVPIYTGYTGGANPSNPPTGSIRIDA